MKRLLLPVILFFPVAVLAFWMYRGLSLHDMERNAEKKSMTDRLEQYGPAARARLLPFFDAAKIAYPPARVVLVGLKQEKLLEVYAAGTNQSPVFIHTYPILAASGTPGPKLVEGDKQVPEGIYPVDFLNPNSKFHLALRLGYPNEFDRAQAAKEGRDNLGGDIMIHGGEASVGCLAMGDEAAEDLFVLVADAGVANVKVILSPFDFRRTGAPAPALKGLPDWTPELYQTIRSNLNELPPAK